MCAYFLFLLLGLWRQIGADAGADTLLVNPFKETAEFLFLAGCEDR
jgi:hypothetical protein